MVRLFKAFFLLTVLTFLAPLHSDAMIRQSALPDMYAPATCLADDARTPIIEEPPEYVAYLVETGGGRYWVICRNDPINNTDPLGLESVEMVAQRVATSGGNADDVAVLARTLQYGSAQEQAYVRDILGEQMCSAVAEGHTANQNALNDEFRQKYGFERNQLGGYSVDVASVLPLGRMLKWLDFGVEIVQGFKGAVRMGPKIEKALCTRINPAGNGFATLSERKEFVVSLMGKNGLKYYNNDAATLGGKGGTVWVAPLDDYAALSTRVDVVTSAGHAPGVLRSYLKGEPMYGIAVPRDGLKLRLPTAADAGANVHWRPGGFTGVEHKGVWTSSGVREFVLDGGQQVPRGSVFFEINADGSLAPIRSY